MYLVAHRNKLIAAICTIALLVVSSFAPVVAHASELNEQEKLAKDLEFIFKTASHKDENGKFVLNEKLIADKFGEENVPSLKAFVKMINGEELTQSDLDGVPAPYQKSKMQKSSWSECVGNKILDATGIGFISGAMWKLIERESWKLLAYELAKVAGKNAIKGGVVGFAASLAWYGVKCR